MGGGGWFVFELVGEAGGCQGLGFGFDDCGSCGVDALEGLDGLLEGFGFEDSCEFGQGELVQVAQVEGGDGGVEEVLHQGVGDGGD